MPRMARAWATTSAFLASLSHSTFSAYSMTWLQRKTDWYRYIQELWFQRWSVLVYLRFT